MKKIVLCVTVSLSACGGSSTLTSPSIAYDGIWDGITSQGYPIHLTIASNSVVSVTTGYSVSLNSLSCLGVTTTCYDASLPCARPNAATPISSSGRFTADFGGAGRGAALALRGQFGSATSVSGDATFAIPDIPGCPSPLKGTATWNAAKSP